MEIGIYIYTCGRGLEIIAVENLERRTQHVIDVVCVSGARCNVRDIASLDSTGVPGSGKLPDAEKTLVYRLSVTLRTATLPAMLDKLILVRVSNP